MNTDQAVEALDVAAERAVSYALRNKFRTHGGFFLMVQEVDAKTVKKSQADELTRSGTLVATKGMRPGTYAVLGQVHPNTLGHTVWMSTHVPERTTQAEFVAQARGRVLIAGFGLGLVTDAVLAKPGVTEVVVVEKNSEVTNIMSNMLDDLEDRHGHFRFKIIYADIFKYKPAKKFDTIYFDIWPTISAQNLTDMMKLRRRYRPWLKLGGWIGCWVEKECRDDLARLEAKHGKDYSLVLELVDREFGNGTIVHLCKVDETDL